MTKLYVGGLPYSMTDESLLQLFAENGYKPVSARIITEWETGRSRGFGFVELAPGDDAARAIRECVPARLGIRINESDGTA